MAENFPGQRYRTEAGAYDEMRAADGQVRPHWQEFIAALDAFNVAELDGRRRDINRLLRENGVSYHVHSDSGEIARPWELDPIPLLIDADQWRDIEAGLVQRATLLDLILKDLYGPRTLIETGLLPPDLVYGHPGFLLPCDQVLNPGAHQLLLYAADLARGPDGCLWVLSDRTQVPIGAGYALESRTVLQRVLPDLYGRGAAVRRQVFFFLALRAQLAALAPRPKSEPSIVVLTIGPQDQTYFEHAYLAAYLGYPLVQGDDLTVRQGHLWLKTLEGLKPVDVVLRRLDDRLCDPLELAPDSAHGIPGLLAAVRQGNVALANPLGSSTLENPGLLPFLPDLARHLLGEDLKLSSVATWWCGQPSERTYVLDNLENLIVKTIDRGPNKKTVLGHRLTRAQQRLWRDRILAQPHRYVGQEQVCFSTAPTLVGDRLEPRHILLRSFLVAQDSGYLAMPGGLARSAVDKGSFVVAPGAEVSKDTWVQTDRPETPISLWVSKPTSPLQPTSGGLLPSRTAENLFWVGRSAERAESGASLLRTVLRLFGEQEKKEDAVDAEALRHLLRGLTLVTDTKPGFVGRGGKRRLADPQQELLAITLDGERHGSITSTLNTLVHNAYAVRERWSVDTWRVIDDLQEHWETLHKTPYVSLGQVRNHLDQLVTDLVAFTGLNMESMTRELGWILLDTGRRIERSLSLIALLRSTLIRNHDEVVAAYLMEAVLTTQESVITHRRRYRAHLHLQTVLEVLLFDETNPRGLRYQLELLVEHVDKLPRQRQSHRLSAEEQLILAAATRLKLADSAALAAAAKQTAPNRELDQLLAYLQKQLWNLSDELTRIYFSHTQSGRQLGGSVTEAAK